MVTGVWHFSFTVGNIERSIEFYCGLLGMQMRHRQDQANPYTQKLVGYSDANLKVAQLSIADVSIGPSGHILELVQYVEPVHPPHPPGTAFPNSAHMAFVVGDIQAEYQRLRNAGVKFRSEPVGIAAGINRGGASVYFLDPDGITLELLQPPPKNVGVPQ
jgi:catechol 2,3-dioxygenase-like lactoylglutathione lyase family enzyme